MALTNLQKQHFYWFAVRGNTKDFCSMQVDYNITKLSTHINFCTAQFALLHDGKLQCIWNVRFIQTKPTMLEKLFSDYSLKVLLTNGVLQLLNIFCERDYNLKVKSGKTESDIAKEFEDKSEQDGIVFVSKEALAIPKTKFDSDTKVLRLTPHESEFRAFLQKCAEVKTPIQNDGKEDVPLMPSNQLGLSHLKWYQDLRKETSKVDENIHCGNASKSNIIEKTLGII